MKKLFATALFALLVSFTMQAQTILGKWKTIDDNTGKQRSTVEIFEKDGKVFGKIVAITDPAKQDKVCDKCSGDDKNRPLIGLEIIKGLSKKGDKYEGGYIIDPDSGKRYKCYLELDDANTLKVRGYLGMALIGRTQTWHRVQ